MNTDSILVLVCGGTILMDRAEGYGLDVREQAQAEILMASLLQESNLKWPLTIRYVFSMDSTDMAPENWITLGCIAAQDWRQFRGILIVTGTNTMAYLSSALSFALRDIPIPVLITGAQVPATEPFSDARANVVNSLRVIDLICPGIFVVFAGRILLGCRAKKVNEFQLDAFASFNSADVGAIGVDIRIRPEFRKGRGKDAAGFVPQVKFEGNILSLTVLPGMPAEIICSMIRHGCRGLIFRSFGSGDIPQSLFPALECAKSHQVPVVNTTQCAGSTMMGINEVGRMALEYKVIQAFDMSMEAMSTKFMWLLGNDVSYELVGQQMQKNLAGEIDER